MDYTIQGDRKKRKKKSNRNKKKTSTTMAKNNSAMQAYYFLNSLLTIKEYLYRLPKHTSHFLVLKAPFPPGKEET